MRWRVASMAFLLSTLVLGVAWLSVQPLLTGFFEAARAGHPPPLAWLHRGSSVLPLLLGLDLVVSTVATYVVLYATVERPLRQTEKALQQLGGGAQALLEQGGGPLLARLRGSFARTARALLDEQEVTKQQLDELRAAHARLAAATTELAASERLAIVGRLASGVAHEVGNPLSGILGYLSVAAGRAKDPELTECLQRIESEVRRIDEIVRSLLDIGRPPSGPAALLDLRAVVDNSLRLATASPDFARVRTRVEIEPGTLAIGLSAPLSQIFLNLFINAAQSMGGEGELAVAACKEGERIRVDVRDTGPGIPSEALPHLFEPFFTTKGAGRGTGLGLAVSRQLALSMKGDLRGSNVAGSGACFTLFLEARESAGQGTEQPQEGAHRHGSW